MAVNVGSLYPGKMDPVSAPKWPYSEPRRISATGAGDGTPWELETVKDIMGMQQGLLIRAGITPSGIVDDAEVSQYIEAMSVVFGRQLSATTDALTLQLTNATGLQTLGYAAQGDGGQGLWVSTGTITLGKAGTLELSLGFLYDALGRQFELAPGEINPRQLGAKGDGATDDHTAFQAAITLQAARGGGVIRITRGVYFVNAQLTGGDKLTWQGDAEESSIITFEGAAGAFANNACIYAAGSSAAIADLNANLAPGADQIVFAAVHGLADDDLFYISDPRDFSYGSEFAAYRAGEFCVATEVVDTVTVDLQSPVYATTNPSVNTTVDTYAAAEVDVLKVTPVRMAMRDLTIIGISDSSTVNVVSADFGRSCRFERLHISNSFVAMLRVAMTFDLVVDDLQLTNSKNTATFNGVQLHYCQQVLCDKIRGGGGNSMILLSADSTITDGVVNREVYISNCIASQQGSQPGSVRCQQNSEYVNISDSRLAGIVLGGDHHRVSNCEIESWAAAGNCVLLQDMTGCDVQISDCRLTLRNATSSSMLRWSETVVLNRLGALKLSNCTFDTRGLTGDPVILTAQGLNDTGIVEFNGVVVLGGGSSSDVMFINTLASSGWAEVTFKNCTLNAVGLSLNGIERFRFEDSTIDTSPGDGMNIGVPTTSPYTTRFVEILGCRIFDSWFAGVRIFDEGSAVRCANTVSIRNNRFGTPTSSLSSFAYVLSAPGGDLSLYNNTFGDDGSPMTQGWAYYYDNVNNVRDVRTTIVGGTLPVIRNAIVNEEIALLWTDAGDTTTCTGALGVSGGDPSSAPAGSDDLAVGDGTGSRGIYLKSDATFSSKLTMGDGTEASRFVFEGDHGNDEIVFTIKGTGVTEWAETEFKPATTAAIDLGLATRRWKNMYGGSLFAKRVFLDNGTILTPGSDISISAGWGTTAAVNGSSRGRDSVLQVIIDSAGTGQSGNPTFTYTYPDGATVGSKSPFAQVTPFGSVNSAWQVITETSTAIGVRFIGTPSAGVTYGCTLLLIWDDD